MLTKRTNILFDQPTWDTLSAIAEAQKTSVGELVRVAVTDRYLNPDDSLQTQRQQALQSIQKIKKNIKQRLSYKEITDLINYGRTK